MDEKVTSVVDKTCEKRKKKQNKRMTALKQKNCQLLRRTTFVNEWKNAILPLCVDAKEKKKSFSLVAYLQSQNRLSSTHTAVFSFTDYYNKISSTSKEKCKLNASRDIYLHWGVQYWWDVGTDGLRSTRKNTYNHLINLSLLPHQMAVTKLVFRETPRKRFSCTVGFVNPNLEMVFLLSLWHEFY